MTSRIPLRAPLALAVLLGGAAGCQSCNTDTATRRGNLDRAADAVLVEGDNGHTFAVISNPELQHLRVLDLTTERFVDAPNRFFPASIPTGPSTRRLATAPGDDTRVYALDSSSDEVFVVRTVEDGKTPFVEVQDPVPTGRAPAGLAAFRDEDGVVELWVTLPEEHAVQVLGLDGAEIARIDLGDGARPGDVVTDPFGDSVVVADEVLDVVHVLRRATHVLDRDLDVGGPTGDLSVGVVDVGDGQAPVALALRTDANVAVALRLFRPGFREDRYAVLGSVEVPSRPMVGYVPDQREGEVVCCRALSNDAVDTGEATAAWAAVGQGDGNVVYLALAAPDGDGRVVRMIDNDLDDLAVSTDEPPVWTPVTGDEDRQPVPALAAANNFGDPPFVPLLEAEDAGGERLTLTWEGVLPPLDGVLGTFGADGSFSSGTVDLAARGARVGDIAILEGSSEPAGCDFLHDAPIRRIDDDGQTVVLLVSPEGITDEDERCLLGDIRLSLRAAEAFTVVDSAGDFLGRLAFEGPDAALALPGAVLSLTPAAAGAPRHAGSTLDVKLDLNLDVVALGLSDAVQTLGATGGFGSAGYLPVAIVGREMDIPGDATGTTQRARRMVIATGSIEAQTGLNVFFACDDAETVPALCTSFR
jgi:hypothetical protein